MKKITTIFVCVCVTILMAVQSLFMVSYLRSHKKDVRNEINEHFLSCAYIDLPIGDYQKNNKIITWLEKDEIMISDYFFDILKIEKLNSNKIRLYIYCDVKDVSISDLLCKEHGVKQKSAKKNKHSTIHNLLKLKSSLPPKISFCIGSITVNYLTYQAKPILHFQPPIYHPPTV